MSDPQTAWAELLLRSLVEAGVRHAIISPGSRSTPLVWAACRTLGLRCHCLIDERSAGFYALGQARISGIPSLLICTSGTAASHYYPAVIEARESGVPLLILSADRPFEAQHVSAHQTIDQVRLFGAYAPYHELGTPVFEHDSLLALRRTAFQVVATSREAPRGAVHLNFRARKPLEPCLGASPVTLPPTSALTATREAPPRPPADVDVEYLLASLSNSDCPLLICGPLALRDSPSPALVRRFVALSGCILCPEATSQLRFQLEPELEGGALCDTYDWLLGSAALRDRLKPDFALQLGATPISSALGALLGRHADPLRYAICAESGWPDSVHQSAHVVRARPVDLLGAACVALERQPRPISRPQLPTWRRAQAVARSVIDQHLGEDFGEAAAVASVSELLPDGSTLVLGNSLPPRLIDRYCAAGRRGLRVCSQRGASGIEGAIASALGSASVAGVATTLLVGDISFLHDIGSLWAAQPERTLSDAFAHPVVIVVLNNGGGRIFEQLPIARQAGVDMRWWTTPHRLELGALAAAYAVPHVQALERAELHAALRAAYARAGVSLIEVMLDPESVLTSARRVSAELEPRFEQLVSPITP